MEIFAIVQQPDRRYLVFNLYKYQILILNLEADQLLEYMKARSIYFTESERRFEEVKKKFYSNIMDNKWCPSWNTVIYDAFIGKGEKAEGNHDKLLTVLELGLLTETDLNCIYKQWKAGQIPLLKRNIIPFAIPKKPIQDKVKCRRAPEGLKVIPISRKI